MRTDSLLEMGLTQYEAKAYGALLEAAIPLPSRQIAIASGVPPSRVYDALRSLQAKKLVVLARTKPMTFEALDPERGLDEFVQTRVRGLGDLKARFLKDFAALTPSGASAEREFVSIYFGEEHRFARAIPLYRAARERIRIISRSESMPVFLLKEIRAAMRRRVKVDVLTTRLDNTNRGVIDGYLRAGARVRYYQQMHGFVQVVFDSDAVYQVFFNPGEEERVCVVVIRNPGYARSAAQFFENAWQAAKPVR